MSSNQGAGGKNGLFHRLALLHFWNAWLVSLLALSGLVLFSAFWREALGEVRIWVKWLHILLGLVMVVPLLGYLRLGGRHWQQIRSKGRQRFNVIVVLFLLLGWLVSGLLLWQFRAAGPTLANGALWSHDLLSWLGLPYLAFHSITRLGRSKEPLPGEKNRADSHFYTRKGFILTLMGGILTLSGGPALFKWLSSPSPDLGQEADLFNESSNRLLPVPQPLAESAPPLGSGADGTFRSYTVTKIPFFTNDNWRFTVDGLVEKPAAWNWQEFVALKRSVQVSDFHCVTGWSVYNNTWEGIPLQELLTKAGVQAEAKSVKFYSGDGVYSDALTLQQAEMEDIMIAVLHDGKPIPSDLGGPVRLIIPQMYAYKSVKWLNRIELIAENYVGYWGQRGYENDAWIEG